MPRSFLSLPPSLLVLLLALPGPLPAAAQDPGTPPPPAPSTLAEDGEPVPPSEPLVEDPIGVPMRVRDFTFPSFMLLDFGPLPAAPLGRGRWAFEGVYSRVNDFQMSETVRDYLYERRRGQRAKLDAADFDHILSLPRGESYYIDGEFAFYELTLAYGITAHLDLGITARYIDFLGGALDGTIFDFHDRFGFGQQGRDAVLDHQFQIVLGDRGREILLLDGAPDGGFADPALYLRLALPDDGKGWRFSLAAGYKPSLADSAVTSGSSDIGISLAADRRWRRNAWIANLSIVDPGPFGIQELDPGPLPAVHLTWIHHFRSWPSTRFFLQALAAEHVLAEYTDSALAKPEFQMSFGLKWDTSVGVLGVALTENLFNYANTPDIGVHASWGYLTR